MVAKRSSHCGRSSSNPRKSPIVSLVAMRLAIQSRWAEAGEGGEDIKLCADRINWNWENEGNIRPLGKKDYALLKADYIYFSCCHCFLIILNYFLWCKCFVYADCLCLP